jgi:predicted CXXCH cytochrome family protein
MTAPARSALLALLLAALLDGCDAGERTRGEVRHPEPDAPEPVPAVAAPSGVGAERCGSCHPEELRRWRGSHHDLAMQPASEASVLGDFDGAELTHFGVTTRFRRRDGRFVVEAEGADGKMSEFEVASTFGVDPLQQYLVPFPGGRLQALSAAWDARPAEQGGARWFDLHPDERIPPGDPLHWTGPALRWNLMCAECHSTALRRGYRLDEDRYETRWEELNVACEACHGPGSAHVAWAEALDPEAVTPPHADPIAIRFPEHADWTFEPGESIARRSRPLESRLEIETCAPCHARRSTLREEPVRGQPLADTHRPALLDADLYHADGQILDEVYVYGSFLQSRMYAAGVTCSDCHDPHTLDLPVETDPDAVCARCHRADVYWSSEHHHHAPDSTGASCVGCHMAERLYMVVDARHDHSFRVPRPDLSVSIGVPNACSDCHADRTAEWAAQAAADWYGSERASRPHFGEVLHAGRLGLAGADAALAELASDADRPGIVRASAVELLRGAPGSAAAEAIERAARDADPLVRMAAAAAAALLPPRSSLRAAQPLLRDPIRTVRIQAASVLAPLPPEIWAPGARARLADALEEYRAVQAVNADSPGAHVNLVPAARPLVRPRLRQPGGSRAHGGAGCRGRDPAAPGARAGSRQRGRAPRAGPAAGAARASTRGGRGAGPRGRARSEQQPVRLCPRRGAPLRGPQRRGARRPGARAGTGARRAGDPCAARAARAREGGEVTSGAASNDLTEC